MNPGFETLRTSPAGEACRRMLDDVYQNFQDPEGNFLEQFQTTGFDARFFELYLYAYFSRSGFSVDRTRANPDFLVTRQGITVAVEATTVNPSTSGALAQHGRETINLSIDDLPEYHQNELAIRFGSALYSKFQRKYWELRHCRSLPFVIAIEAFFDDRSLGFSVEGLARFVYGLAQTATWSPTGELRIDTSEIDEHVIGNKRVPSNFFSRPGAEHISAVLFSNSGTSAKFTRMGYLTGYGNDSLDVTRTGFAFNPEPTAMDPTLFYYHLDASPSVERWGEGLVVLHNPNSIHPLPRDLFVGALQGYIKEGVFRSEHIVWQPIASWTEIIHLGDVKKKLPKPLLQRGRIAVFAITKQEFQDICGFMVPPSNPIGEEHGWFSDETNSFLGVVIRDKIDNDWGYVVLARDEYFQFRCIDVETDLPSRNRAREELQLRMARLLREPQRIFPQGS